MMAGNPNSWSMNGMYPQFVYGSNSSNIPPSSTAAYLLPSQDLPIRSWSQLLLGGLGGGEEERFSGSLFHHQKKSENWEDQVLNLNPTFSRIPSLDVKQETTQSRIYDDEFHTNKPSNSWAQNQAMPCISTNSGGASKKARVQQSSAQPAPKVRKEKLGDRVTVLHQIVSPFGKTDTASVLSEAIGYIRFLQGQIEALSSPFMSNPSVGTSHHPQHSDSESQGFVKDLRSRGLCLVPISCTQNVGNDTGADYWAPTAQIGDF